MQDLVSSCNYHCNIYEVLISSLYVQKRSNYYIFRLEIPIELFKASQKSVEKMGKKIIFYYCQAAAFAPLHFKPTIEIN